MVFLLKFRKEFASYWAALLAALVIIAPTLWYGPWVPFCDLIAIVALDSYPPALSWGPFHYYTLQITYILTLVLSRLFVDLGVSVPAQTSIFYLVQALVFFGVIWKLLELLVPNGFLRQVFIVLGALAFWNGVFLWGGPLAFSFASALLAVATYLSVQEAAYPGRTTYFAAGLLALLAVASHPFALPFCLILFAVRVLFLPRARFQSVGVIVLLLVYQIAIVNENPRSNAGNMAVQLFHWYPQHFIARIVNLFAADISNVQTLFHFQPTFLLLYFGLLGLIHLLGFICSPAVALIAKDKPALRMLATLNTVVLGLYLLSNENSVIAMWPQRILSIHSSVIYVAGVAGPIYLGQRYARARRTNSLFPIPGAALKPVILSLFVVWLLAAAIPILQLGRTVEANYSHLRNMLFASGVTNAVLVTSDLEIEPFYLRSIPFLLFSDPEVIKRRLFFVTEWHLIEPHFSRIAARTDPSFPQYAANFYMEQGLVSIDLERDLVSIDSNTLSVVASSYYATSDTYKPENVLDRDEKTAWAAQGSGPAELTITPKHSGVLESIRLVARKTGMLETWRKIVVKRYLKDIMVSEQTFELSNAATKRRQNITLQPVETDKIQLDFSDPVTTTITGQTVSPAVVNPGYAEIVLNWKR